MKPEELIEKVGEYGGDIAGIKGRFMGNADLYAACFEEFWKEPAFEGLEKAMAAGDYDAAFESAHAIKGLTGNMGLTPLYTSVCVLVESLRAKSYDGVVMEYLTVREQLDRLKKILL